MSSEHQPIDAGARIGIIHLRVSDLERALRFYRDALAAAVDRLLVHGVLPTRASDHGVCESAYVEDPDGNGIELYSDRVRGCWPQTADGPLALIEMPLDIGELFADPDEDVGS